MVPRLPFHSVPLGPCRSLCDTESHSGCQLDWCRPSDFTTGAAWSQGLQSSVNLNLVKVAMGCYEPCVSCSFVCSFKHSRASTVSDAMLKQWAGITT